MDHGHEDFAGPHPWQTSTHKGALLVGLLCWHIYPDLNVVGPIVHVRFGDELVGKGGVVTLGIQSASPDDDLGVQWSLSLSHLRYYGDPVAISTSTGATGSRISMEDLHMVALGAVFGAWKDCITDPQAGAKMVITFARCFGDTPVDETYDWNFELAEELRKHFPSIYILFSAAKRLLQYSLARPTQE